MPPSHEEEGQLEDKKGSDNKADIAPSCDINVESISERMDLV
jgi:hypothetical protein